MVLIYHINKLKLSLDIFLPFSTSMKMSTESQRKTKDGRTCYNISYPKYKIGEEVVREVSVIPTYGNHIYMELKFNCFICCLYNLNCCGFQIMSTMLRKLFSQPLKKTLMKHQMPIRRGYLNLCISNFQPEDLKPVQSNVIKIDRHKILMSFALLVSFCFECIEISLITRSLFFDTFLCISCSGGTGKTT